MLRFWASSTIMTVFRPARRCSIRNRFSAISRCALVPRGSDTPRSARAYSSISSNGNVELVMKAELARPSIRWTSVRSTVVFPVPTSPVIKMKPFCS
jgi:hypothetical protein